jgi:hypothetical protein
MSPIEERAEGIMEAGAVVVPPGRDKSIDGVTWGCNELLSSVAETLAELKANTKP